MSPFLRCEGVAGSLADQGEEPAFGQQILPQIAPESAPAPLKRL
jgi:hypothetical protein